MTEHVMEQPQTKVSVTQSDFSGAILGLQGDVLHGWAMDNAQQEHRPIVEVFIDGASVALVRADQYEPSAPTGDQFHGFAVQLRQRWLDEARLITAQIANQTFVLEGQLSLPAPPSEDSAGIASQVWHTGGLRVAGWCWDPKAPNRHVEVTVREGNRVISKVTCDEHNQALTYRTSSKHGFSLNLPWELADGKLHELEIVNDLGQALTGSPIRLCCRPEGLEGLLQQLNAGLDNATLTLIKNVAKEQTLRLPKSAGWQAYPEWFEAFQRLDAEAEPELNGLLGLLVLSDGDHVLERISLSSLGDCLTNVHKVAIGAPGDLLPALSQLLESGCDRILPVKAGDRLAPMALAHLSALLDDGSTQASWAYADCDHDGPNGERSLPWLKPTWDIDFFIGADVFTPGAIYSTHVIKQALALLKATASTTVNWNDLTAGVALATYKAGARVSHLPLVLYHRAPEGCGSPEQAEPCPQRLRAIEWLCEQIKPGAKVSQITEYPALLRVQWPLPAQLPSVSIIVPTRDQYKLLHACIEGLLNNTDYLGLEIIVVDNQSNDPQTLEYLSELATRGVRVLNHPYPFNYSTINNRAVQAATGELICLLNNDIEIIESDWLKKMVAQVLRPNIGAVGAKLLWPNMMVQHAGVVVGINGLAAHAGNSLAIDDAGYLGLNQLSRRQSAVTAACILMRKETFTAVGGLNETAYPVAFNDVDLCLRIQQAGMEVLIDASVTLIHAESASRGKDLSPEKRARAEREQINFSSSWRNYEDPYYHPSLCHDYLTAPYGGLSLPPPPCKKRCN